MRALRLLAVLLAIVAGGAKPRAAESLETQVIALRASSGAPRQSAETDAERQASVVSSDSRSATRAGRPGEETPMPSVPREYHAARRTHERNGGLDAAPVASRSLAFPFYATAPPPIA